jgi:oxalate decarboxylase/phosphoglucose isomerase-like protein (cupin superfamily)
MAVIRAVIIAPGENTGWHYHPAAVCAVLLSGVLTRVLEDGTVETTRPGQLLVEAPDQRHIGHNTGPAPVVILAVYQNRDGCPLVVPAAPTDRGTEAELALVARNLGDRCVTPGHRDGSE